MDMQHSVQHRPGPMPGQRGNDYGDGMRRPGPAKGWLQKHWWQVLLGAAGVLLVGWLAFGYVSTKAQLDKLSNKSATQGESKELVSEIGKTIELPDETPTLATVNDASKLKGQEFFRNAQDGDKVLIFSNSGRALLYRPSTKKVIEYSKVDLNAGGGGASSSSGGSR